MPASPLSQCLPRREAGQADIEARGNAAKVADLVATSVPPITIYERHQVEYKLPRDVVTSLREPRQMS